MIRSIRHNGYNRHRPGVPVIVCDKDGKIISERDGIRSRKGGTHHMDEIRFRSDAELEMRVRQLEERVANLEKQIRYKTNLPLIEVMARQHGETVRKDEAARILGVTRATVYSMLADGRLESCCEGRRVLTRSIAAYIEAKRRRE